MFSLNEHAKTVETLSAGHKLMGGHDGFKGAWRLLQNLIFRVQIWSENSQGILVKVIIFWSAKEFEKCTEKLSDLYPFKMVEQATSSSSCVTCENPV